MEVIIFSALGIAVFIHWLYSSMPQNIKKIRTTKLDMVLDDLKDVFKSEKFSSYDSNKVTEFFKLISDEFDKASLERGEKPLSNNQKLKILAEILNVEKIAGLDFALKHLKYELDRFREFGVREDNNGLF
ncbi:MAG: hypothetical protein SPI03_01760 [Campylobacter sputorum]|uniref:hypothetical protein n=1 Tax=Campylobacter sputorum TaxID=206 RepID=UPI000B797E1E|nr:hypothetical protein [Campylobacter sputorum]ASM38209.1 hypothetical protein CSPARA_0621 [Campylobacter sputorum bv. paraureolyticus LMG 11764]MDY6120054.1 hypothetical protein [Campylobacter sputorum]